MTLGALLALGSSLVKLAIAAGGDAGFSGPLKGVRQEMVPLMQKLVQESLPDPWSLGEKDFNRGNILGALLAVKAREKEYQGSTRKSEYLECRGTLASFVGNDQEALAAFDGDAAPTNEPADDLSGLAPIPALNAIQEAAKSRQAVFINEAHHVPRHRAFTAMLLQELQKQGFRYFAAETLSAGDGALQSRGYPTADTGYYTMESSYGDLIRTALKLGFTVVPYESADPGCQSPPDDPMYCQNRRERGQAENLIARILNKDPKAKIIVHAGYGHIEKQGGGGWIPMGRYFRELSGIEPLCIDQVSMTEHSAPQYETPDYRQALARFAISEPAVLKAQDGGFWVEPSRKASYDLQVFHPRGQRRDGRPDWLLMNGARQLKPLPSDACLNARPCAVQAFYDNEGESAIPVDQLVIEDGKTVPALALPSGTFVIRVTDRDGQVISRFRLKS